MDEFNITYILLILITIKMLYLGHTYNRHLQANTSESVPKGIM